MPGQLAWVAVSSPAELPAETGLPGSGPALIRLGVRLSLTPAAKLTTGRCCMCGGPGAAAWGFWLSKQQLGSDAWGMAGAGWDWTALSRPAADGRLPVCLEKAGAAHNMVSVRANAACRMHGNTLPCASRGRGPGTPDALPGSITCTGRRPALHGSQQHRRLWTPFPPGIPALLGASLGSLKLARAAEPPAELRPFRHLRDQPRAGALALRVSRSSRSSSGGPTHLAADTSACTQARACRV